MVSSSRFAPAAPLAHAVLRAVVLGEDLARLPVEVRVAAGRRLLRLRRLGARRLAGFSCGSLAHDCDYTGGASRSRIRDSGFRVVPTR